MSNPIQPLGGLRPAFGEVRRVAPREPDRAEERIERDPATRDREAAPNVPDKIEFDGRTAEFSYDKDLDRIVVKIYSSSTEPREVVREIPPEEYRQFAARFRELLGVLFDQQA